MATVLIFNESSLRRTRKNFRTEEQANKYYDSMYDKRKDVLVCEPREKYFSYRTELGNVVMVQKMY